jgi:hypothetical protein
MKMKMKKKRKKLYRKKIDKNKKNFKIFNKPYYNKRKKQMI